MKIRFSKIIICIYNILAVPFKGSHYVSYVLDDKIVGNTFRQGGDDSSSDYSCSLNVTLHFIIELHKWKLHLGF